MKRFLISLVATVSLGLSLFLPLASPALADGGCPSGTMQLSSPLLSGQKCISTDPSHGGIIFAYLRMVIQFLSGAVGLVIVLMIVIGGVQYITSVGDAGQVKAAKNRITNAITGLILFLLMFAILNYLIPGGLIG